MSDGVNKGFVLAVSISQVLQELGFQPIPIVIYTDLYLLYKCLVKLGITKEKRLMIDIMALRESYENREIQEVRWINRRDNLVDSLIKKTPNTSLTAFVDNNAIDIRVEGWVNRPNQLTKQET